VPVVGHRQGQRHGHEKDNWQIADMKAKPNTIDEFLAEVTPDKRATLEKLRKAIRSIVPKAEECITYGVAAFRLNGKPIAGFAAAANHCSYFPMSSKTIVTLQNDLKNYDTSKGAIRFAVDKPLPAALIRKLLKTRMAEIAGQIKKSK
jgi:uncharacterized protein YdhG (YjbR/CyaY superfamily)